MEVAMFNSFRLTALRALIGIALLSLTGCSEILTYANKSREEGMRLYSEKMYADAAGAFRNAARQDPRDYHSHFYLGVCYEQMQQYQQAFQEYHTALDVMARTPEGKYDDAFRLQVIDTLASAMARNDDREVELNRAEKQARENQSAEHWFLLAKVYRLRGDADSAIDAYRRACHWDNASFPIRKEFGLYLLDPLNQRRDAEYYLRQAYRLDPDDDAVNAALERLGVTPPPAYKPKEEALRPSSPPASPAAPVPGGGAVQAPRD
jgi:tetratricopeptide (TPR) repeat protein